MKGHLRKKKKTKKWVRRMPSDRERERVKRGGVRCVCLRAVKCK